MARPKKRTERVLILWNSGGEAEDESLPEKGPQVLPWDPEQTAMDVTSVQDEIDAIVAAVRGCGFKVRIVDIEDDLDTLLAAVRRYKPHVIFNLVEIFNDQAVQEGYVAGLYDLLGVPYTGAGPLCLMTCQRKSRTKVLLEAQGVPTPAYQRIDELPVRKDHGLEFPLIVKPAREDASGGVHAASVVNDHVELTEQVRRILEDFQQPALVEEYISGREIHVAILGNDPPEVLPLLEFEFDDPPEGDEDRPQILSYEAKWDTLSPDFYALDVRVPARKLPRAIGNKIRQAARDAYKLTGCRDYARVDIRVDEDGNPHVLEVNPNPDLAEGTGFMLCAEQTGRTFQQTIGELLDMALARGPRPKKARRKTSKKKSA